MQAINRALVIVGSVLVILFALAVIISPQTVLGQVSSWFSSAEAGVVPFAFVHMMVAVGAVVVIFASALLLISQFGTKHDTAHTVRLKSGNAELAIEAIVDRLAFATAQTEDVLESHPVVTSTGTSVDVVLHIIVHPQADLAPVVREVESRARKSLEQSMNVRIHHLAVQVQRSEEMPDEEKLADPPRHVIPAAGRSDEA
jgi:hypothetical protein